MRNPLASPATLAALLAVLSATPAAAQRSIAELKLSPADARGRTLVLEGEVVEVRALSPRSLQGFYRLLDGTDPLGVLVRTTDLPASGGPFRVEARLSQEVLRDGLLLLDESGRRDLRAWQWWSALAVAGIGLLALAAIATLYSRAARDERQRRLAPPLWLIPAEHDPAAPPQAGDLPPLAQIDLGADEEERLELEALATRKRRVLRWAGPGLVLAIAGTAWAGVVWRAEAGQPSFVLLEPVSTGTFSAAVPAAADTPGLPPTALPAPDAPTEFAVLPAAPDSTRLRRPRRDSVPVAVAPTAPPPATAPAREAEPVPTPAAPQPAVVTESPAPVERPEPVRPEPVRPDPAALRRMAESELEGGISRFVAAVVGKQPASAATIYASSDSRRARFLEFLTQYQPEAAMLGADASTIGETSAEAVFRLSFRWRGDFGVARRKDARFIATARRAGDTWDFESIRLLENLP